METLERWAKIPVVIFLLIPLTLVMWVCVWITLFYFWVVGFFLGDRCRNDVVFLTARRIERGYAPESASTHIKRVEQFYGIKIEREKDVEK